MSEINKYRSIARVAGGALLLVATAWISKSCTQSNASASAPVADDFGGVIGTTVKESKEWWPEKKKAPEGAPNVIYFLIDDAGYGTSSAFGGLMETPTLDSLANHGLRFTNFHTTSICS